MGRLLRIALTALLVSGPSSQAQEPSGRIDLEELALLPSQLFAARVVFTKSSAVCPEDRSILQISTGWLRHHRMVIMQRTQVALGSFRAIDDNTYRYRVATPECRLDLLVRQQVRQGDGSWRLLSVARSHRPSLSQEEREEVWRQNRSKNPISPEDRARFDRGSKARASSGSLGQGVVGMMSAGVVFEDAPKTCIEAVGDFLVDQDGVTFMFLTKLPGEVNRFVIERVDVDDDHSRLYFMRADCRYEITIGASDFTNGAWVARPVAPYAPAKARIFIQKNPDTRPSWLDRSD